MEFDERTRDERAARALAHIRAARTWLALENTDLLRRVDSQLQRASLVFLVLCCTAAVLVGVGGYVVFFGELRDFLGWIAIVGGLGLGVAGVLEMRRTSPLRHAFSRLAVATERFQQARLELKHAEEQLEGALRLVHSSSETGLDL